MKFTKGRWHFDFTNPWVRVSGKQITTRLCSFNFLTGCFGKQGEIFFYIVFIIPDICTKLLIPLIYNSICFFRAVVRSKNEQVLLHDYYYVKPLHFKNRQIPMLFDGLSFGRGRGAWWWGYGVIRLAGLLSLKPRYALRVKYLVVTCITANS